MRRIVKGGMQKNEVKSKQVHARLDPSLSSPTGWMRVDVQAPRGSWEDFIALVEEAAVVAECLRSKVSLEG